MQINIDGNAIVIKSKVKNMEKGIKCLKIYCIEKDGVIEFSMSTVFEDKDRFYTIGNLGTIAMYDDHTIIKHIENGMIKD